jgi:MFS family permease
VAQSHEAASQPVQKPGMLSLLKQPRFRSLWLAQTVSWSGDHFTFLALVIVITQLTGSAGAVALLLLVMTVPRLLFGMVAGVFVDRWNRKHIMVVADAARGLLSLCLVWLATPETVWLIYPLAFVVSSLGVFFMPARGAVMKAILKEDELLPANILMQTTYTITLVAGPALAGLLIGVYGPGPAFAFDALTFFVSSTLVATIAIAHIARSSAQMSGMASFWIEFRDGLAFVRESRTVMGLLIVLTVISLAAGAINSLFAPFMINVIGVGATQLGLADSAQGLGMVAGGLLAGALAARLRANWLICGALIVCGLTLVGVGLTPSYVVVLVLMALLGLGITPIEAVVPAIMQKVVPMDKMGRVGGTMNTCQSVAMLISMGAAGVLAGVVGLRTIFVAAGVIGLVAGIVAIVAIQDGNEKPEATATLDNGHTLEPVFVDAEVDPSQAATGGNSRAH